MLGSDVFGPRFIPEKVRTCTVSFDELCLFEGFHLFWFPCVIKLWRWCSSQEITGCWISRRHFVFRFVFCPLNHISSHQGIERQLEKTFFVWSLAGFEAFHFWKLQSKHFGSFLDHFGKYTFLCSSWLAVRFRD